MMSGVWRTLVVWKARNLLRLTPDALPVHGPLVIAARMCCLKYGAWRALAG